MQLPSHRPAAAFALLEGRPTNPLIAHTSNQKLKKPLITGNECHLKALIKQ